MPLQSHPKAQPGESSLGYLLRLADRNGYYELKDLLIETNSLGVFHQHSQYSELSSLAQNLGNVGNIQHLNPEIVDVNKGFLTHVTYAPVLSSKPRVCPACMAEGSKIKADWHIMQITHCEKHHVELIDKCSCNTDFEWNESLLNYGCDNEDCGKAWLQFDNNAIELPAYMKHMFSLNKVERIHFINDLTAAALIAVRPYESIIEKSLLKEEHFSNVVSFLSKGYDLLTNHQVIGEWISTCATVRDKYRPLGNMSVYFPIYRLQSVLIMQWLIKNEKPSIASVSPKALSPFQVYKSLCPRRNVMASMSKDKPELDFINQINRESIALMLNIPITEARAIFNALNIDDYANGELRRNNIGYISKLVENLNICSNSNNLQLVSLANIKSKCFNEGIEFTDVLIAIFDGSLEVALSGKSTDFLDSILIDETKLLQYIKISLKEDNTKTLSLTQVSKMTRLPRNVVAEIATNNVFIEVPSTKNRHDYSANSVVTMMDNYFIVSLWAEKMGLCESKIIESLLQKGFSVAFGYNIFKKSDELHKELQELKSSKLYQQAEQFELFN